MGGGEDTGPNPTDRRKKGGKHQAVVDAQGVPLSATATAANVPDVKELLDVVDAIPPVAGKVGQPKQRPDELYGDRASDSVGHREELRDRSIEPKLAEGDTEHGSGLGRYRGWRGGSSVDCTGTGSCGCGRTGTHRRTTAC
jgi:hypothetical protein